MPTNLPAGRLAEIEREAQRAKLSSTISLPAAYLAVSFLLTSPVLAAALGIVSFGAVLGAVAAWRVAWMVP